MFDLWYAVGSGILFPELVTGNFVDQAKACFVNVPQHVGPLPGSPAPPSWVPAATAAGSDLPGAGYVNENNITALRNAMAASLKATVSRANDFPPPVSLHAAATISQWITAPLFGYQAKIQGASRAFASIAPQSPGTFSTGFRALVGVLFIDPRLPTTFANEAESNTADQIAAEFHIEPQEREVIDAFAKLIHPSAPADQPITAPPLIDEVSVSGWANCAHVFLLWADHIAGMLN